MARNVNALYRLLAENVDFLLYESEASDQAKQLGLSYAGFGYWKDGEGHVVARTLDGKLVKLEPGHKASPSNNEPKDFEPDEEPASQDQVAVQVTPEKALTKLTATLIDYAGLNAAYPGLIKDMAKAVAFTIGTGEVPDDETLKSLIDVPIQYEEWESIKEYLGVLAKNKNSKLISSLRGFFDLKPSKEEPKPEPELTQGQQIVSDIMNELPGELMSKVPAHVWEKYAQGIEKALYSKGAWGAQLVDAAKESGLIDLGLGPINGLVHRLVAKWREQETMPGYDAGKVADFKKIMGIPSQPKEPEYPPQDIIDDPEPEKSEQDKFADFTYNVAEIIGINPSHPKWDAFIDLLRDKMWKATTSTQINYARALLKKSGLLGATEDKQWDNWKKILKTFKKEKQVASGPKNPGKIKNKKAGQPVEKPAEPAPTEPAPEEEPKGLYPTPIDNPEEVKAAQEWYKSLPEQEREDIRNVVYGWVADLEKNVKDFGDFGVQAKIGQAIHKALKEKNPLAIKPLVDQGIIQPKEGDALAANIVTYVHGKKKEEPAAEPVFDKSKIDPKWHNIPNETFDDLKTQPEKVQQQALDILHQADDVVETWELNDLLNTIDKMPISAASKNDLKLAVDTSFKRKKDAADAAKRKQQSLEKKSIEDFDKEADTFGQMYKMYQSGGNVELPPEHADTSMEEPEPEPATTHAGGSMPSDDDVTALAQAQTPMTPAEQQKDLESATVQIIQAFEKNQKKLSQQERTKIAKLVMDAINDTGAHAEVVNALDGKLVGMGFGPYEADDLTTMVYHARKKKEAGQPMTPEPETEPELKSVEETSLDIFKAGLEAGGLSLADFTPDEQIKATEAIKMAMGVASSDDAKKWLKNVQKELHLSKTEYDAMYADVFKKRAEKMAKAVEGGEANPFEDIDPPPQAIKGLEKNMTGWAKGDPDKVIAWIKKKIAEDPEKSKFLKWQAVGLGKYHGVPYEKLKDILPLEIKDKVALAGFGPQKPKAYDPDVEQKVGDFSAFIEKTSPGKTLSPEEKKHLLDALTIAKNTGDPSYLDSLFTSTSLSNTQISALKDILAGENPDAVTPEGPVAKKGEAPPAPPEEPKHDTKDAAKYTKATLNNIGVDFGKLTPEDQKAILDAVKGALNSTDEFGIMYFLNQLKADPLKNKKGVDLTTDAIDELAFQILSDKEKEGDLNKDPEAFKKYLDPAFAVQEFLDKHPQFRDQLTPEQKEKLINAAKVGLAYTGKDGYAKAKAYYQDNLVGQIPGFDDKIFHDWRHGLKDFHDNLKNSTASIEQKKQELIAKKKAEQELKAALDKLGKGDMAQQVGALMSAAGIKNIPAMDQQKVQLAILKALEAPTTQDMMDELDAIRGEWAYGYQGSYTGAYHARQAQKVKSVDAHQFNMLQKLVASQYKKDHDKYAPKNEPKPNEHSQDRAKRVLRNWLHNSNFGVHHFPNTSHGEKQAIWDTVQKALQETDPKKVNPTLNDLLTTTSINDKQLESLKKAIHAERQNPEGLQGKPLPDTNIQKHSASVQNAIQSGAVTYDKFKNSNEFKKLLTKYGASQSVNKDNIEGLVIGSLARNTDTEYEKKLLATALKKALQNNGLDETHAKNLANYIARESHKKSPLHSLAKAAWESKHATPTTPSSSSSTPKSGKEYVASLTHSQDPHGFARNEWVKGEEIRVSHSGDPKWSASSHGDSSNADSESQKQDAWRKKNLSKEDDMKYNWAADSWQATSQWGQNPNRRKAMLDIFTKTIEGPPPMLTKVDGFVERGLDVKAEDFADFIAAFKIGEKVYLSPQGFSGNTHTPRGYAESYSGVGVLLRVKPNKHGYLKAGRVAYRSEHYMHGSEQELVVGTSDSLRVQKVIKHVAGSKTYYEIEMQYDEDLKESVQTVNGYRPDLWKGVPRNTVKMLIKYGGPQRRFNK